MLLSSDQPLSRVYDVAMLDLDGVVYIGSEAVPGAAQYLAEARNAGMRCAFITNNAARPPGAVATHLRDLGVEASEEDVVTSAQAAARVLADRLGTGARVVLLGGLGLEAALRERGLEPVGVEDEAAAVVSGYGPEVRWSEIMRAAVRVRGGLWWVASNTDTTIPTPFGVAPGHGVLVDAIRRFSGVEPVVAGKPARPLLDETARRAGGARPLMVGDRLDTDIAGARNADVDALLVLTGVTGLDELVAAAPGERPTFVGLDLRALNTPHPLPVRDDRGWRVGDWAGRIEDGRLAIEGAGGANDWWRTVATNAWAFLDERGDVVDTSLLTLPPRADLVDGR